MHGTLIINIEIRTFDYIQESLYRILNHDQSFFFFSCKLQGIKSKILSNVQSFFSLRLHVNYKKSNHESTNNVFINECTFYTHNFFLQFWYRSIHNLCSVQSISVVTIPWRYIVNISQRKACLFLSQ